MTPNPLNVTHVGTVNRMSHNTFEIVISHRFAEGLDGIEPGDRLDILYWMHNLEEPQRSLLKVHPRGDGSRPLKGVFGLRSPMRPNPIGVSTTEVKRVEPDRLLVSPFDAEDGSPVVDIKAARTADAG